MKRGSVTRWRDALARSTIYMIERTKRPSEKDCIAFQLLREFKHIRGVRRPGVGDFSLDAAGAADQEYLGTFRLMPREQPTRSTDLSLEAAGAADQEFGMLRLMPRVQPTRS